MCTVPGSDLDCLKQALSFILWNDFVFGSSFKRLTLSAVPSSEKIIVCVELLHGLFPSWIQKRAMQFCVALTGASARLGSGHCNFVCNFTLRNQLPDAVFSTSTSFRVLTLLYILNYSNQSPIVTTISRSVGAIGLWLEQHIEQSETQKISVLDHLKLNWATWHKMRL